MDRVGGLAFLVSFVVVVVAVTGVGVGVGVGVVVGAVAVPDLRVAIPVVGIAAFAGAGRGRGIEAFSVDGVGGGVGVETAPVLAFFLEASSISNEASIFLSSIFCSLVADRSKSIVSFTRASSCNFASFSLCS
jgi:hypothetical protein